MTQRFEIWTDGACSGNPGPGGWGALIHAGGEVVELHGGEPDTTNNRMELTAAIAALEWAPEGSTVVLYTDSQYVKDGLTKWMDGWKRRDWQTADKKPVKNQDLWLRLDLAAARHSVEWQWVRSHDGNAGNERADELARLGTVKARIKG